jgi:hypothetical protein
LSMASRLADGGEGADWARLATASNRRNAGRERSKRMDDLVGIDG